MAYYHLSKGPRTDLFTGASAQRGAKGRVRTRNEQTPAERRARKKRLQRVRSGHPDRRVRVLLVAIKGGAGASAIVAITWYAFAAKESDRLSIALFSAFVSFVVIATVIGLVALREPVPDRRATRGRRRHVPDPDDRASRARRINRRLPDRSRFFRAAIAAIPLALIVPCFTIASGGKAGADVTWDLFVVGTRAGLVMGLIVFVIVYFTIRPATRGLGPNRDSPFVACAKWTDETAPPLVVAPPRVDRAPVGDRLAPPRKIVGESLPIPLRPDTSRMRWVAPAALIIGCVVAGGLYISHAIEDQRQRQADAREWKRIHEEQRIWLDTRRAMQVPFPGVPRMTIEEWLDTPPDDRPAWRRVIVQLHGEVIDGDDGPLETGYFPIYVRVHRRDGRLLSRTEDPGWWRVPVWVLASEASRVFGDRSTPYQYPAGMLAIELSPPHPDEWWLEQFSTYELGRTARLFTPGQ